MRSADLFCSFDTPTIPDTEILMLTENASLANESAVFVCIKGARNDGHRFAATAYQNGCRFFVAEKPLDLPSDACVILCSDTKKALGQLACRFYGNPSHRMHLIGITGTKGKTTTALLLSHVLNTCGVPCGYIGTNGVRFGDQQYTLKNTTPDPVTLQKTLCEMQNAGVFTAVIEVSSQALLCHRTAGMRFETVLFTNLSPDHIGPSEHPNLENYKACKMRLFTDFQASTAIINVDDSIAEEILSTATAEQKITVSTRGQADFIATNVTPLRTDHTLGVAFTVSGNGIQTPVSLPLIGTMNVQNALMAMAVAKTCFDIPLPVAANALQTVSVDGRSEVFALPNGASVVIDYAHNGTSLYHLLTTLREYKPNRLIVLFGSVGERTKQRRHELGAVAAELCDLCILTSDNPGNEKPEAIISEILTAFEGKETPYLAIPDRESAIRTAVDLTQAGDILVLAGKGHENYQLIGNEKTPFSEREILADAIKELVSYG